MPSGRVIALGRLMLASLYAAVLLTRPPLSLQDAATACAVIYLAIAATIATVSWNDWWLDSRLGGWAHAIDIGMFTLMVYLTEADSSPFFTFFVFVLLAAAIRWGWRATALTAILLTILYVAASLFAKSQPEPFLLDLFAARIGHLIILSLVLIWFGVNQRRSAGLAADPGVMPDAGTPLLPLEGALAAAMAMAGSVRGAIVWSRPGKTEAIAVVRDDETETVLHPPASVIATGQRADSFVYQWPRNRGQLRDAERNLKTLRADQLIDPRVAELLSLSEGVAVSIAGEAGEGRLYLEQIPGISSDLLDDAPAIGAATQAYLRRRALIRAAEDSAEARSRLAIARDLHDSVVQFLAGAAFRLEGMKRAASAGREQSAEIDELKQLLLHEQGELRTFIAALRSETQIAFDELASDLQSLASRLARQWNVQCGFTAAASTMAVPSRLHLDAQHMVREAIANAVKHAGAKTISIRLEGGNDELRLDFINDGSAYPKGSQGKRMPLTLNERVAAAGGTLDIGRGMGVTKVAIRLPAGGRSE